MEYLKDIKTDTQLQRDTNNNDVVVPVINKLTRRKLKEADTWYQWNKVEFQQLNMYEKQEIFGPPCELPPNVNVINLL